jgi:hypothetical protein
MWCVTSCPNSAQRQKQRTQLLPHGHYADAQVLCAWTLLATQPLVTLPCICVNVSAHRETSGLLEYDMSLDPRDTRHPRCQTHIFPQRIFGCPPTHFLTLHSFTAHSITAPTVITARQQRSQGHCKLAHHTELPLRPQSRREKPRTRPHSPFSLHPSADPCPEAGHVSVLTRESAAVQGDRVSSVWALRRLSVSLLLLRLSPTSRSSPQSFAQVAST